LSRRSNSRHRKDCILFAALRERHVLGIVLVDRRKILRAIAELGSTPGAALAGPSAGTGADPDRAPNPDSRGSSRRTPLPHGYVLRPSDSTGIAARLDAEEWRDLVGAHLDVGSSAVMEMVGHMAKSSVTG
jgi:hypothetical protein